MLKRVVDRKAGKAVVKVEGGSVHEESLMMAAHVLSRAAEVWLGEGEVELKPKAGQDLEALAAEFAEEVLAQELRRRVAAANRSVRDYIVTQALLSAAGQGSAPPPEQQMGNLSADQEEEIQRLIAEAESELGGGQGEDKPMEPSRILKTLGKDDAKRP